MERAEAEAILDGDRETAVALLMRLAELIEANQRLEARVAELEQRLNRSSRNSSLPPSQDPVGCIYSVMVDLQGDRVSGTQQVLGAHRSNHRRGGVVSVLRGGSPETPGRYPRGGA
jgi:hypothetical protein